MARTTFCLGLLLLCALSAALAGCERRELPEPTVEMHIDSHGMCYVHGEPCMVADY